MTISLSQEVGARQVYGRLGSAASWLTILLKKTVLLDLFWARSEEVTTSQPWAARSARRLHQAALRLRQELSVSPKLETAKGWPGRTMV